MHHVVVGRGDCALAHALRHEEEVIALGARDGVIDNGARRRIAGVGHDAGVDALSDDHKGKRDFACLVDLGLGNGILWRRYEIIT